MTTHGLQAIGPAEKLAILGTHMHDKVQLEARTKHWTREVRQMNSIQLMNTNLNSLVIIATFLAGVQAQAISFSIDNNSTNLQTAANALFFAGLFVDVLAGTIGIVGSVNLQRTCMLLEQRKASLAGLKEALQAVPGFPQALHSLVLVQHLRSLERVIFPLLHSPWLWNSLSADLKDSAELLDQITKSSDYGVRMEVTNVLADYRQTTNNLANSRFRASLGFTASFAVPYLVIAGLCCFMAGASCLVRDSQPAQVWATSFGVLGSTVILIMIRFAFVVGIDPRPIDLPFSDV
ncbi:hypothetical protein DFH09DRAFT_258293 [Mycena vulgaris]|nr:hypothetical protein DFH09DRAFT_258293 [Mycena vulgaris]